MATYAYCLPKNKEKDKDVIAKVVVFATASDNSIIQVQDGKL